MSDTPTVGALVVDPRVVSGAKWIEFTSASGYLFQLRVATYGNLWERGEDSKGRRDFEKWRPFWPNVHDLTTVGKLVDAEVTP